MNSYISQTLKLMTILSLSIIIFGCGGGGSSSTPSTSTTSVSGTVLAGPATGAVVSVKANGVEVAKSAPSAADGSFTVAIPTASLASDLIFEASGGTFPDEATTTPGVTLATLTAHATAGSLANGSNVTIDPSSTIVQKLVAGGKTKTAAETAFVTAFGYTPDCSVKPAFATISSASTTSQRLSGLRAAAFSQLTKDLGLTPDKQFELIQALTDDLSDGVLDGKKTGGAAVTTASGTAVQADIANSFAKALMTFQTSSLNKSKLTPDKIDAPPFAKKALTASYIVEFIPGMMAATQGKTTFQIKLSNRSDGSAATGKAITLMPKMHMSSMSHSAPVDAVLESATPGTYDATAYYLMASGPGMGVWELKVNIGNETATFYPPVAMSMGTTTKVNLKGVADLVPGMMGGTSRNYPLFYENLATDQAGSSTFKLFVSALDDKMMMSWPAVSVGTTLHNENNAAVTVDMMLVEASTDKTNWVPATPGTSTGHFSVSGLTGVTASGKIYVRLKVNGEQKTTDGKIAVTGTNDFATFTISSGGGGMAM